MRRVETDRNRWTRDQAIDRRRLYEVPERPLIEPQGHKGAVVVRDRDESVMEGGRILKRRPFKGYRETFSNGFTEWSEKYDAADAVRTNTAAGWMGQIMEAANFGWGVFQIWGRPGLETDTEIAAHMALAATTPASSYALLGLRLGGTVEWHLEDSGGGVTVRVYDNYQTGVWLALKEGAAQVVVQHGDGTSDWWPSFSSAPSITHWMWATLAVKGGIVWASVGDETTEQPLGAPQGSQNLCPGAGQAGVGLMGPAGMMLSFRGAFVRPTRV